MGLLEATPAEADLIGGLLDDYLRELSTHREVPVGATDSRSYEHFDSCSIERGRHPFLIRSRAQVAGFALVRDPRSTGCDSAQMAEFYMKPGHRRRGIGQAAACAIFRLFPGPWELQVDALHSAALEFWASCASALSSGDPTTTRINAADGNRLQYNFLATNADPATSGS